MEDKSIPKKEQPNNPLHGVRLIDILEQLVEYYGWERLAIKININCFKKDPSIKSPLFSNKVLRSPNPPKLRMRRSL